MKIKTLIVDDEPLARQRIRLLLEAEPDFELLGECADGPAALEVIQRDGPDLLFLDVQMPVMDGFALLAAIPPERLPVVIFVTAFNQHALKAFDVSALDYLLKPFKPARFHEAVERARQRLAAKNHNGAAIKELLERLERGPGAKSYLARLQIKMPDKIIFLKTTQVECLESAGNYVVVQAGNGTHLLRETLNVLERRLDPVKFLRISRSAIVNLDFIKELQPQSRGNHLVVLQNGKRITMTCGLRKVEQVLGVR
jgi:two-component system LytT family response regulator